MNLQFDFTTARVFLPWGQCGLSEFMKQSVLHAAPKRASRCGNATSYFSASSSPLGLQGGQTKLAS
jgi:hypothetical protein